MTETNSSTNNSIEPIISDEIIEKWQNIVNILAKVSKVPVALIMRVQYPYIEVFRSNITKSNPYKVGDREHLTGLYCESVINTNKPLLVENALKDPEWNQNPDIKLGMISYFGYPIVSPTKKMFGTICILDVKERQYSEQIRALLTQFKELIESHLELLYNNQKLQNVNIKLDKALKRETLFRDLLNHDFNNILQTIQSSAQFLKNLLFKAPQEENLENITRILEQQVIKGKNLINNALVISDLRKIRHDIYKIEFRKFLNNSINHLKKSYKSKEIKIKSISSKKEIFIKANELIANIIDNLLINAIKHNEREEVLITITCEIIIKNQKKYLKAEFIDNARGIPDDQKKVIFNESASFRNQKAGLGIGLSLVKQLIKIYGGEIAVQDRVQGDISEGSIFTIFIPLA
ncbi:MAG: Signal transduction histidine kinase [Promethearchaeota archaeon]|nr:MAG: Signal transduction histidine kinase [Candidatus Lokiarchaeota archaeon]